MPRAPGPAQRFAELSVQLSELGKVEKWRWFGSLAAQSQGARAVITVISAPIIGDRGRDQLGNNIALMPDKGTRSELQTILKNPSQALPLRCPMQKIILSSLEEMREQQSFGEQGIGQRTRGSLLAEHHLGRALCSLLAQILPREQPGLD